VLALANADDVSMAIRPLIDARVTALLASAVNLDLAAVASIKTFIGQRQAFLQTQLGGAGLTCHLFGVIAESGVGMHLLHEAGQVCGGGALPRRDDLAARLVGELEDFLWVG
jgi:hypothetical protein